ncbi:MAG: hypothetical protein AAFY78_09700 [Cyanobacteria bacterium J06648_16]
MCRPLLPFGRVYALAICLGGALLGDLFCRLQVYTIPDREGFSGNFQLRFKSLQ